MLEVPRARSWKKLGRRTFGCDVRIGAASCDAVRRGTTPRKRRVMRRVNQLRLPAIRICVMSIK